MAHPDINELIANSLWGKQLAPDELARVQRDTLASSVEAGETICHRGLRSEFWYGVVDGLVKVSNVTRAGRLTSLMGIPAGAWFGEGSVMKNEIRPYDVVALRKSRLALVPAATFHWLLGTSLPFNHFLIHHLNARLAQFVIRVEHLRSSGPEMHVAHCLAELFNTDLYPETTSVLRISQEEIALLAGVSRQLVNRTLRRLEEAGLLQVQYGSIRICDIDGLRAFAAGPEE